MRHVLLIRRLCAVAGLYCSQPLFLPLMMTLAGVMLAVKVLEVGRQWLWIDDLMTLWLMIWMIQGFLLGLWVKRQLISPMMRLLPGGRTAVIGVFVMIFTGVATGTGAWMFCLPEMTPQARQMLPLVMLCGLTYLLTVMIAYVSVRWVVMASYIVLLGGATRVLDVVQWVTATPQALATLMALVTGLAVLVVLRMAVLSEGMMEFAHLLSWPLYRSSVGQAAAAEAYSPARMVLFSSLKNRWRGAQHWDYLEKVRGTALIVWLLVGMGVFEAYLLWQGAGIQAFYVKPLSNFLVYVVTPVFFAQSLNYRIISFGSSSLLWPIRREELLWLWGVRAAGFLGAAWLLTVVLLAVVPGYLLGLPCLATARFWAFLALTGVCAYAILAWIALLAAMRENWRVGVHMIVLCLMVQAEFFLVTYLGFELLLINISWLLIAGLWLTRKAYYKWLEVEY